MFSCKSLFYINFTLYTEKCIYEGSDQHVCVVSRKQPYIWVVLFSDALFHLIIAFNHLFVIVINLGNTSV